MTQRVDVLHQQLTQHMKAHAGSLLTVGTFASDEFDRLYLEWIRERWNLHDVWVREVWKARP